MAKIGAINSWGMFVGALHLRFGHVDPIFAENAGVDIPKKNLTF